jgi:Recombination endonuclease VII
MEKKCSKCHSVKLLTEFNKDKAHSDGFYSQCKKCRHLAREKLISEIGKEANRKIEKERLDKHLSNPKNAIKLQETSWKRLNIIFTVNDYNTMLEKQNGVCAACHKPETRVDYRNGKVSKLAVDHCHKTGKVRGLLCHKCNSGIGLFNENIELMLKALEYLKRNA